MLRKFYFMPSPVMAVAFAPDSIVCCNNHFWTFFNAEFYGIFVFPLQSQTLSYKAKFAFKIEVLFYVIKYQYGSINTNRLIWKTFLFIKFFSIQNSGFFHLGNALNKQSFSGSALRIFAYNLIIQNYSFIIHFIFVTTEQITDNTLNRQRLVS